MNGGAGADTMLGGAGDDSYVVDNALDRAIESVGAGTDEVTSSVSFVLGANFENLFLSGAAAINGTGNALANAIAGNSAANILNGGGGADNMAGGLGNDTYIVDNAGDVVTEAAAGGTDLVQSAVSHTLGANIERLTLTGTAALSGTGNELGNILTGNAGANVLNGGVGADGLAGGLGDDVYVVDNAGDIVTEVASAGTDRVQSSVTYTLKANVERLTLTGTAALNGTGNELGNILTGNAGNNVLNGGAGADGLVGGLGNDTYIVDHAGDIVTEAASAGTDTVQSSVTYTLKANVERLTLTGTSALNGTGNELGNILTGNAGNNVLNGGAGADGLIGGLGNDTYVVDNAGDIVTEAASAGTDMVQSSVSYTLKANVERLTLTGSSALNGTGNELGNILTGNAGNNVLNGAAGADGLAGGLGNDTYVVDHAGDIVTEAASAGTDTVQSSVSYTLALNVENLILAGTAASSGAGNALDNAMIGNTAANVLKGGSGNDTISGGDGNDSLFGDGGIDRMTGGSGADRFTFQDSAGAGNADHIVDFAAGSDKIVLENAVFASLGAGPLAASAFVVGTAATDASDRIIYDAATGNLFYDIDGSGSGAALLFATLDNMPATLSAIDFIVI